MVYLMSAAMPDRGRPAGQVPLIAEFTGGKKPSLGTMESSRVEWSRALPSREKESVCVCV